MNRRTVLAGIGTALAAGCSMPSSDDEEAPVESPEETTDESSVDAPDAEFNFTSEEGTVSIAHMGGDNVEDEATSRVVVRVNGDQQNVVYHGTEYPAWVADEEESAYAYPISVGNTVSVEAAAGDTVELVWVSQEGDEAVLAEHEVSADETTEETADETTAETTEA